MCNCIKNNNKSVIAPQRAFWQRFFILCKKTVSDANTIRMWITRLEDTEKGLKTGKRGQRRYAKTPNNGGENRGCRDLPFDVILLR